MVLQALLDVHEYPPGNATVGRLQAALSGPNVRAKLPAEEADARPRRDDGNASPERPGIGCRSGSA
jgi:hypothetical protein